MILISWRLDKLDSTKVAKLSKKSRKAASDAGGDVAAAGGAPPSASSAQNGASRRSGNQITFMQKLLALTFFRDCDLCGEKARIDTRVVSLFVKSSL